MRLRVDVLLANAFSGRALDAGADEGVARRLRLGKPNL